MHVVAACLLIDLQAWVSKHFACPFGAVASVHAWERIGALFAAIARKALHVAVYRYVDDFFAPERPQTLEHAMQCFARLVRVLLGQSALAEKKLECGLSLCILGVDVSLSSFGVTCRPAKDKVAHSFCDYA